MPIDRIGKGGGAPPQVPGAGDVTPPTKTFEVDAPKEAQQTTKTEAVGAVGSSPLEQLRAGKIDVNQYVDLKLDEATSHLKGLHAEQMQSVRELLKDKIVQDP